MCRKLSCLICITFVLACAGANVALGDTVWEGKITDSQDCVEESPSGNMSFGSSDLEFMNDGGIQTIGLRFINVQVPAGATINKAYVVLTAEEINLDAPVHIIIQGQLTANAPAFSSTPGDITSRALTTALVKWDPLHWTVDNESHQTPDVSPIIEEIINQPGWVQGFAMVLIFNQDPDNPSQSHLTTHKAATPNYAPVLHIEWSLGDAGGPNPEDGATDVWRDTDLSWTAGVFAAATNGHTVYFGESFNDVNTGVGGVTQSSTVYDPGRLEYGTTYYWRVRENNGAPDFGVNEGRVWSFTTEFYSYPIDGANISASASSAQADSGPENTINGSGLDENDLHATVAADMWLSGNELQGAWIQYEFDKAYKLHEMWVWNSNQSFEPLFGLGFKDVTVEYSTDGAEWTALAGAPEFAKGSGTPDYAHNTTVDFGGATAKYVRLTASSNWGGVLPQFSLSEVRFFFIPVNPSMPSPDSGATDVDVDVALSWRAGREAVTHNVYFSTDEQAVTDGTVPAASAATASYSPPDLNLGTTYYWKVAEVNDAETPSTWESNIWSFTTSDHIVVEDFESYNDYPPNEIYSTWLDGYVNPANGSQVGNLSPPLAETTIVHGGSQSMPLFYSNTGGATFSEGTRTFAAPQNWTTHGVTTLVLYFFGAAGNTGQLYAKINGTKIPYDGNAGDIALEAWQVWNIDLASSGVSVQSVTSLAIGVDGNGAAGTLYFDDVGLYAAAPASVNEWQIAASDDDGEEHVNAGTMASLTSSDLELGYEGDMAPDALQTIGCRWQGIAIPKGVTITEAWVQFSADDVDNPYHAPDVSVIIEGELSANPAAFSSTAGNISSRPKTTAQVVWDIPQWTSVHAKGPEERTPDISSIIQEIVNQNGWAGNAIVLMFRDNPAKPSQGTREAESFDGSATEAPLLHIGYR